jgi:NADP-dependent 3-hydroxy acid dehydrogenase YdfG
MTPTLTGTVSLVTGASSGIGAATARALAAAGSRVVIAARRRERLDELAAAIARAGGEAHAVVADVTDGEQARALVDAAVAHGGRLDTLVNNAGLMLLGPIVGADAGEWERMVRLNLDAMLHCTHAALPHLLKAAQSEPRRVADLVNISSVAGRVARNGSGVYNATKWGVNAFSESLRQEVTRRHLRVSIVEPGAVDTELAEHNRPEIQRSLRQRFANMERLRAEDIADAVVYIVTRPRHMAVNEMLIRPTEQEA